MNESDFEWLMTSDEYDSLKYLTEKERLTKLNKIRNYARFCLTKNRYINPSSWKAFTPEERMFIELYNKKLQALEVATRKMMSDIIPIKVGLFRHFYENGEKVGSTLKRKIKNEKRAVNITEESIKSWAD